jgi:ferrous iron transport protein A
MTILEGASAGSAEAQLDELRPEESGTILRVEGATALTRRLLELGFVPGTEVQVVRYAPLGDPIELRVRDLHFSLRRSQARLIHVVRS